MRLLSGPVLLALSFVARAQDTAGAGFQVTPLPYPGATPLATSTSLPGGEVVVFDGTNVDLYDAQGQLVRHLSTLPGFVFPSFILADPSGSLAVFGESSTGAIQTLNLGAPSAPDFVVDLDFNYDAAFGAGFELFVSAATCGLNCGTEIWSVDLLSKATRLVARLGGASGPLALDAQGNLFYATSSALFPAPPGSTDVLRWSAAQIAGPAVLGRADAQFLGGGFDGGGQLAYDPEQGALFLAENNFGTGAARIRRLLGSVAVSPVVLEGTPFMTLGNMEFIPGPDVARFLPHQPPSGGSLRYTSTDFFATVQRSEVTPRRPVLSLTGPGASGPGPFQLQLDSGPPSGLARIAIGPTALLHSPEHALVLGGLPHFLALDLPTLALVPGVLPLDGTGTLDEDLVNPGGLNGFVSVQLVLLDSQLHLAGTSTAASF